MTPDEEVMLLTQQLVRISSTNPTLSTEAGTGEGAIANFVQRWFIKHGFEVVAVPAADPDRPSILAVKRGTGGPGAKSLPPNGHIDIVSLAGYVGDGLSGELRDGRIYGRGSADMKGGLAAAMVAAAHTGGSDGVRGDVWVAAVADEEDASRGSLDVLKICPNVHGAIFPEPTDEANCEAHRGFVWFEITVLGRAAHGSRWDQGVDAITQMGLFLACFQRYCNELRQRDRHPLLEFGSAHAGKISGGEKTSTYPAHATLTVQRRTLRGESDEMIQEELVALLQETQGRIQYDFRYSIRKLLSRPPLASRDGPLFQLAAAVAKPQLSTRGTGQRNGANFWTDAALFSHGKAIESIVFGPKGSGIHTEQESVEVESLQTLVSVYSEIVSRFCA